MTVPLRTVKAVCPHDCPDTCSMAVTVDAAGRAVSLRGDPDHPFTKGFLCAKVNRYLDRVYHPERLMHPLKRVGPKGKGEFERVSWGAAIAEIAANFKRVAAGPHGPEAILPYSYAGTMGKLQYASLDRRLFGLLGASHLGRTICATAGIAGSAVTLRGRAAVDPEAVVDARVIVNWGSNTSVTNVHLWVVMNEARKRGATIVTIDPHKSRTARKSDWHLPIRPGTDAALALGVMHVLFRDRLTDDDYMTNYCTGTTELRRRLAEYDPGRVAAITTLPVADIVKLAALIGTARRDRGGPAFIRLNYGLQRHGGGAMAVRAVTCIPAVTGDWRVPGGGAMLSTGGLYPFDDAELTRPHLAKPGTRTVNMVQLAEALAGELPGSPVQAIYVYNSNPAAVAPDQSKVHKGLAREDLFTAVHELFLTDTARFADIVLPATSQLEQFDLHGSYGHTFVQANAPAIAPLGECKPNTEVFRLLAAALDLPAEHFADSDEELARKAFPDRGEFAGIDFDSLKTGPARLNLPREFAPHARGNFGGPGGKCEFYSESEALAGRDPLPNYTPPHEDPQTKPELAATYPIQLVSPPSPNFLNSSFVNVDHLRRGAGEVVVELSAADAQARDLRDGDWARVFNARGEFRAIARVGDTVKPGVAVSYGIWWGRYTPDGKNVNSTTSTARTDLGGGGTFFDNLVQVERAG